MFCKTCGASLPDGAKFCTACGAPVIPEAPVLTPDPAPTKAEPILDMPEPTAPMYTPVAPEEPAYASPVYASADALVPSNVSDSVFNWGLAGLICSLFISILGIIFSAMHPGHYRPCDRHCLHGARHPSRIRAHRRHGLQHKILLLIKTCVCPIFTAETGLIGRPYEKTD